PVDVRPQDVERVRVAEDRVVALRGGVMDVEVRARRDVDPGDRDRTGGHPGYAVHRRGPPQGLLDRAPHELRVLPDEGELPGMAEQEADEERDEVHGGAGA